MLFYRYRHSYHRYFYHYFYSRKSFGLCPSSLEDKEILNNRLNRGNSVLIFWLKKMFIFYLIKKNLFEVFCTQIFFSWNFFNFIWIFSRVFKKSILTFITQSLYDYYYDQYFCLHNLYFFYYYYYQCTCCCIIFNKHHICFHFYFFLLLFLDSLFTGGTDKCGRPILYLIFSQEGKYDYEDHLFSLIYMMDKVAQELPTNLLGGK